MSEYLFKKIAEFVPSQKQKEVFEFLSTKIEYKQLQKGTLLHKMGVPCHQIHFVNTGLARAFYLKDGKDISCYFAPENNFITAINSFLTEEISQYNVELLEDSQLMSFYFEDLKEAMTKFPSISSYFNSMLKEAYIELVERVNLLQFYTAKEKYNNFIHKHPDLFNRLSLGHIASYLGMTQENLSRVRAKT